MLCECISRWVQQSEPRGSQAAAGVCRERFLPIPTEKSASAYLCRSFKRTLGDQRGKKDGDVKKGDRSGTLQHIRIKKEINVQTIYSLTVSGSLRFKKISSYSDNKSVSSVGSWKGLVSHNFCTPSSSGHRANV